MDVFLQVMLSVGFNFPFTFSRYVSRFQTVAELCRFGFGAWRGTCKSYWVLPEATVDI